MGNPISNISALQSHVKSHVRSFAIALCLTVITLACTNVSGPTEVLTAGAVPVASVSVPTTPPLIVPTVTPLPRVAAAPPTAVPPTAVPPTAVPPTAVPPTAVPPTAVPQATTPPAPTAEATATVESAEPATDTAETRDATSEPASAAGASGASDGRTVTATGYQPLGVADGIPLALPVARIELIGFHEASHPGAKGVNAASTGVEMITLASRSRNTPARSAADIVVPPGELVVAPATGTIVAANDYTLYCEHNDQLVYIEPDGMPGWQVRVFHVVGEPPPVGTRVIAGESRIADSARTLPFESQVDEFSGEPSWPHVHIEVVDTTVPDTRPPGPGCP